MKELSPVGTMADSGFSSASTTSTACGSGSGTAAAAITIDEMHGLLSEFRAVYESRLRCLDDAEPCEDIQKVSGVKTIVWLGLRLESAQGKR